MRPLDRPTALLDKLGFDSPGGRCGTRVPYQTREMGVNKLESEGYNLIMDEVRLSSDPGDPWGSNIAWLFGIADFVYAMDGEIMPGYRPSPMGVDLEDPSYEMEMLHEIYAQIEDDDLRRAYYILSRRDDILRAMGKNY